jgi:hypothetical protein
MPVSVVNVKLLNLSNTSIYALLPMDEGYYYPLEDVWDRIRENF